MKNKPIHQNLNTSFVNVGALVRYLRGLQFVGSIRIELSSYEADIVFTDSQKIAAREHDHIAGRISHGEQALQRILIRAQEPHGRIHVYKSVDGYAGREDGSVLVDRSIARNAREMAASHGGTRSQDAGCELVLNGSEGETALVLGALSEMLRTIDESLAKGRLSFGAAFRVACDAITPEYPFMQKGRNALVYENGEVILNVEADADLVASAVFAALRPIFNRLRGEVKYTELLRIASEHLLEISTARWSEFDRFGLARHIEKLLANE